MRVATETKLVLAVVVVVSVLVLWQIVGVGQAVEAATNPTVPQGKIVDALNQRLLSRVGLKTARPNLWIHLSIHTSMPQSIGTELPGALNRPTVIDYVPGIEQLCAYSVLYHNAKHFNVVLVTDEDLPLLLPGWNVNMAAVPEAARQLVREIAMLRVIYYYGGMLVPATFAATGPFARVMSVPTSLPDDVVMAFEAPTTGAEQDDLFAPSGRFLYSGPLNPTIRSLIDRLTATNGTAAQAMAFHDTMGKTMLALAQTGKVHAISGKSVGAQDAEGNPVTVADAINGFKRTPNSAGIWIPARLFQLRKYGWAIKDSPHNILAGSTWLAAQIRESA